MAFISVIGKRYEENGLWLWFCHENHDGKSYNKGVRALKLLLEAFSHLRMHSLAPQIKNKADCFPYIESVTKLREAVGRNDEEVCRQLLQDIERQSSVISTELNALRENGRRESATFGYWDEFIDMVEILLLFIRADREGVWDLHLDALSEMLAYFFAYDRINYA